MNKDYGEYGETPPISINDKVDVIAEKIFESLGWPIENMIWIEHYPEVPGGTEMDYMAKKAGVGREYPSFDLVQFSHNNFRIRPAPIFSAPRWTPLTCSQAESLFGHSLR